MAHQTAPASRSAADRIVDHLGPELALEPRKQFHKNTVLIIDGALVLTRDHSIAAQAAVPPGPATGNPVHRYAR